ncbi:hypothetical protein [Xanthomonas citri]|uniref:hypothetical protein n=1 Tax=Xanthomonas citri TaxID=346 RepID=UPI001584286F|nr:hypothetical protein [Xanthomonas citri]
MTGEFSDGSYVARALWRVWDFHCHTPASYQWNGSPNLRGAIGEARQAIVKQTVLSLKNAEPDVFVIMDYWTFDGYLAVADYVRQHPDELSNKQVFPGIELRVESSLDRRLNVHLIIDPTVERQVLQDVLNDLKLSLRGGERGLSEACLMQYARELAQTNSPFRRVGRDSCKNSQRYSNSLLKKEFFAKNRSVRPPA